MPVATRPPLKKALSIAVQYSTLKEYSLELPGACNDPKILSDLLHNVYGYEQDHIIILLDDESSDHRRPTKENIERAMHALVADAQPGDHFVFHFSGHGAQVLNEDGTEKSGFDDVIWPADVEYDSDGNFANYIKDDEIHDVLVNHVPLGAHFMMIFDCCHSGTMADLPNDSADCPPLTPSSSTSSTMSIPSYAKNNTEEGLQRKTAQETFFPAAAFTHDLDENAPAVADIVSMRTCEDISLSLTMCLRLHWHNPANHAELLRNVTREIAKITAKINSHLSSDEQFETPTPEVRFIYAVS
ncbi:caspase domain-containing protein [Fomitopsis serialis]|uniref:caspase domain-containing protein n=1 Tax=Fomitopsis serialis TaxID=139415 RepID=UPI0020086D88|nr:caspase domain-containing protein [Neoantrodia serialis]KAH9922521.1 caspase domain-containing protein [Neoantrodia serialis]